MDPRLPKPTYVPKPNLDFIKESMPKEEEDDASEKKQQVENITKDMDKLNLKFDSNPKIDNNFLNEFNESNYNNKNFPQNKKKLIKIIQIHHQHLIIIFQMKAMINKKIIIFNGVKTWLLPISPLQCKVLDKCLILISSICD